MKYLVLLVSVGTHLYAQTPVGVQVKMSDGTVQTFPLVAGTLAFNAGKLQAQYPDQYVMNLPTVRRWTPTLIYLGTNCTAALPCRYRFGQTVWTLTGGSSATLIGGTGLARFFFSGQGRYDIFTDLNVTCNSNCLVWPTSAGVPLDDLPLYTWFATNGIWATKGDDLRASLAMERLVTPGTAMIAAFLPGGVQISLDTTTAPIETRTLPVNSTDPCFVGQWAAGSPSLGIQFFYYRCVAPNQWMRTELHPW